MTISIQPKYNYGMLDAIVAYAFVVIVVLGAERTPYDDEWFLRRFAKAKKRDRRLQDWQFALAVLIIIALEVAAFQFYDVPWMLYRSVVVVTAFVPANFLFFCNLVVVGNRREVVWMGIIASLCAASILRTGWLRLDLILGPAVVASVFICWQVHGDPFLIYRKGLRLMDEANQPAQAAMFFERAVQLAPQRADFQFHLGRAYRAIGREEDGLRQQQAALALNPELRQQLESHPLYCEEWWSE